MNQSLHYKPINKNIASGVVLEQCINTVNSPLKYVAFSVLNMTSDSTYTETLQKQECCIVVLTGKASIQEGQESFSNLGTRQSVFDKIPTDSVYVSNDKTFTIHAQTNCQIALCYAPCSSSRPTKLIQASENTIEHRGKYNNQRQVINVLPDDVSIAESLLITEVFTDTANFSSYPPHRHDHDNLPEESLLEETYYHLINPEQGFVFQRVYTDNRDIDETMSLYNQDVAVVPKGYHPVGVPDGYESYYLNVMAGPKRIWKFHNEPDHAWILERE